MHYLEIIHKLYNLPEDANAGYTEEELSALELRLKITIPDVLRRYYKILGRNGHVNDSFNRLTSLGEIGFSEDGHLVFYEENQAVVLWGIAQEDIAAANPPVYGTYDSNRAEWFMDSDTMEHFLLSMAWWNGALGGLNYTAFTDLEEDLAPEKLSLVTTHWKEQAGVSNQLLRFFTNDYAEIIVFTIDEEARVNAIYFGTNKEDRYREVIHQLDMEWSYRSDRDV
jgi:hypothetical protein